MVAGKVAFNERRDENNYDAINKQDLEYLRRQEDQGSPGSQQRRLQFQLGVLLLEQADLDTLRRTGGSWLVVGRVVKGG